MIYHRRDHLKGKQGRSGKRNPRNMPPLSDRPISGKLMLRAYAVRVCPVLAREIRDSNKTALSAIRPLPRTGQAVQIVMALL